jgi:hypothetical protein
MAISLGQRLRLWWKGSQRRREERDADFLAKNASWAANRNEAPAPSAADRGVVTGERAGPSSLAVDLPGLQAAYLDRSGVILYYLDLETGEVVESREELADQRYTRVPTQSDEADQQAFLRTLPLPQRARFQKAASFRAAVAEDRTIEKAWYNFKNDRATAAIDAWLKSIRRSG